MSAFRAALVALGAVVLTTACAAGQQAQTANERPTLDGTYGQVGSIQLEGVAFRPPSGSSYSEGAEVPVVAYIVNNGRRADSLVDVTSSGFTGGWDVVNAPPALSSQAPASSSPAASSSASPQSIPPGQAVGYGLQDLAGGASSAETIVLKGLTQTLYPGTTLKVTFEFARAGSLTLTVPVKLTTEPNTQTLPGGTSSGSD